jgi:hypothetical protein
MKKAVVQIRPYPDGVVRQHTGTCGRFSTVGALGSRVTNLSWV